MSFVTSFKEYLAKKKIPLNNEQKVFCNYLSSFHPNAPVLTMDIYEQFYRNTLLFPYWQNRINLLQKNFKQDIKSLADSSCPTEIDPDFLSVENSKQLVTIQDQKNLIEVTHSYLHSHSQKQDRITVLPLAKDRVLAILLKWDGSMEIMSFGPLCLLHKGKLEPLTHLSYLHYNTSYNLKEQKIQIIEDENFNFFIFTLKKNRVYIYETQGLFFQKSSGYIHTNIMEKTNLFYLLKKIENLFIQTNSDPHYKQLMDLLHEHYRQILSSSDKMSLKTQHVLAQAKSALKNIYPKDRLLFVLTANIDFHYRRNLNSES